MMGIIKPYLTEDKIFMGYHGKMVVSSSINTWGQLPLDDKFRIKDELVVLNDSRCRWCLKPFNPNDLTVDHIIPIAAGGPVSDLCNMELLCVKCHNKKTKHENRLYDFKNHYS
jgi:HNH endonuclease